MKPRVTFPFTLSVSCTSLILCFSLFVCLASALTLSPNSVSLPDGPAVRPAAALLSASAAEVPVVKEAPSVDLNAPLPRHPKLQEGRLANGLEYVLLPLQGLPVGGPRKVECHLEVLAGSADELEDQRGMAHIVEHITYMGSRKRDDLLRAGGAVATNAYTDFHHTVYFASLTVQPPPQDGSQQPPGPPLSVMLPLALHSLADVVAAPSQFSPQRLEAERAAVLSEASFVNTLAFREETQTLSALHKEPGARIGQRFPIGLLEQIRSWALDDVKRFHAAHYRPDNCVLYLVGDFDPQEAVALIEEAFGGLRGQQLGNELTDAYARMKQGTAKQWSRHLPPAAHVFPGVSASDNRAVRPHSHDNSAPSSDSPSTDARLPVSVWQHELVRDLSLTCLLKRPMQGEGGGSRMATVGDLKALMAKRVAVNAFGHRMARAVSDGLGSNGNGQTSDGELDVSVRSVDMGECDSPREGCRVCVVKIVCDVCQNTPSSPASPNNANRQAPSDNTDRKCWQRPLSAGLREVRRMADHGLTEAEFAQTVANYRAELMRELQRVTDRGGPAPLQWVSALMSTRACRHTAMDTRQELALTLQLLDSVTLGDANREARGLTSWLAHCTDNDSSAQPSALMVVAPKVGGLDISPQDAQDAVRDGVSTAVEPPLDPPPPPIELMDDLAMFKMLSNHLPSFAPLDLPPNKLAVTSQNVSVSSDVFDDEQLGVRLRRLSNGVRVNLKQSDADKSHIHVRVIIPGGRFAELPVGSSGFGMKTGALQLGLRTLLESGAFGNHSRQAVESFCTAHHIYVNAQCMDEWIQIDLTAPIQSAHPGAPPPFESALQLLHQLLATGTPSQGMRFEPDALARARRHLINEHAAHRRDLQRAVRLAVIASLSGGDPRLRPAEPHELRDVTLEEAAAAVRSQMATDKMEVTIVGDLPVERLERLALTYLGSLPPVRRDPLLDALVLASNPFKRRAVSEQPGDRTVHVVDSDERAYIEVASVGPALDGSSPTGADWRDGGASSGQQATALRGGNTKLDPPGVAVHPSLLRLAAPVLQDLLARRMFALREERQLTYDAGFELQLYERWGGVYAGYVHASPGATNNTLAAARQVLREAASFRRFQQPHVAGAVRQLLARLPGGNGSKTESGQSAGYWLDMLGGCQLAELPSKSLAMVRDHRAMLLALDADMLQKIFESLDLSKAEGRAVACVGTSGRVA